MERVNKYAKRYSVGITDLVLAIALTEKKIHLYTSPGIRPTSVSASSSISNSVKFSKALTLEGHEDWIRCLDFTQYPRSDAQDGQVENDVMLASGSQDGYIRLWRISPVPNAEKGISGSAVAGEGKTELDDEMFDEFERTVTGDQGGSRQLSTKAHVMAVQGPGGEGLVFERR
jgi:WD40 repeat protein